MVIIPLVVSLLNHTIETNKKTENNYGNFLTTESKNY